MSNTYFITGTDTGVGKTLMTQVMMQALINQGKRCVGFKPLASGCELIDGQWRNDDALKLQATANIELPYDVINPIALQAPLAPHIAAAQAGRRITTQDLERHFDHIQTVDADYKFIEGAGGWLSAPLSDGTHLADWVAEKQFPVILVVGLRLGCINHALLTVNVLEKMGCPLRGWIANQIDPDMLAVQENIKTLSQAIAAPCLGVFEYSQDCDVNALSQQLSAFF